MIGAAKRLSSSVSVGLIARRDALLTQLPTAFEESYHDYRDALDREHARPFQKEFFFKKGTPLEAVWDNAVELEEKNAKLGGLAFVPKLQAEELKRLEFEEYTEDGSEVPDYSDMGRKKRDTVYYFERNGSEGVWKLPSTIVKNDELLHEAAERIGNEIGLQHFVIGKMCVAHKDSTFYVKSRMWNKEAQADRSGIQGGYFTKQEITDLGIADERIISIIN